MYLNKILITTDFSEASSAAFGLARHEAQISKSELTLLHVCEVMPLTIGFDGYVTPLELIEKIEKEALAKARKKLEELASKYFTHEKVNLVALTTPYSVGHLISDYARENNFGLIVVASQGKGAIKRLLLGSTAERISRISDCPVLVVAAGENQTSAPIGPYQHILVTTDFSHDSEQAFKYAAFEAKLNTAKVTLGHVTQELIAPELLRSDALDLIQNYDQIQNNYISSLEKKLKQYAKGHFPLVAVETKIIEKTFSVANSITEFAKQNHCDLIVISTHGAGPHVKLVGGVTEKIIRQANCPILVVSKIKSKA